MENGEAVQTELPCHYAGFWLRVAATLVDAVVLVIPLVIFDFIATMAIQLLKTKANTGILFLAVAAPAPFVAVWLYSAVLESSSWQATLGKKLFGLYVTDLGGRRLTLMRATARAFAKFVSSLTAGIGYLLCGFTEKKQALHDMIAGSLVMSRTR